MKVGDLVICRCQTNVWYKDQIGTLVGFAKDTKDPMVMYGNGTILRLARSGLEVLS
jgi:hypothetical protein